MKATALFLLAAVACCAAQAPNVTEPSAGGGGGAGNGGPAGGSANDTSVEVSQAIPAFSGVRSCVPFNVLVLPAQRAALQAGGGAGARAVFSAAPGAINSTNVTLSGGVLAVQLAGGFATQLTVRLTLYTDPATPLSYAATYGSGDLVLGPGAVAGRGPLQVSGGSGGGRVVAAGVNASDISVTSSGVAGHHVDGSFSAAAVRVNGVGTTTISSSSPAAVTVRLTGISTLVANVPEGSTINGTADGLSHVIHATGQCNVQSSVPLFRFPPIFGSAPMGAGVGGGGGLFDSNKCTRIAPAALQARVAAPDETWSCGLVVDGSATCSGANASAEVQPVVWNLPAAPAAPAAPAPASPVLAPAAGRPEPAAAEPLPGAAAPAASPAAGPPPPEPAVAVPATAASPEPPAAAAALAAGAPPEPAAAAAAPASVSSEPAAAAAPPASAAAASPEPAGGAAGSTAAASPGQRRHRSLAQSSSFSSSTSNGQTVSRQASSPSGPVSTSTSLLGTGGGALPAAPAAGGGTAPMMGGGGTPRMGGGGTPMIGGGGMEMPATRPMAPLFFPQPAPLSFQAASAGGSGGGARAAQAQQEGEGAQGVAVASAECPGGTAAMLPAAA